MVLDVPGVVLVVRGPPTGPVGAPMVASRAVTSGSVGAVTALDASTGSDYLACGYFNGMIKLWQELLEDIMESWKDGHGDIIVMGN